MTEPITPPGPINSAETSTAIPIPNIARDPGAFVGSLFAEQLDQSQKVISRKKFKGVVLYVKTLLREDFVKKFEEEFTTYILKAKTTSESDVRQTSTVDEVIVYVPEISGCLPFPDMTVIEEKLQHMRDEAGGKEIDEDFTKLSDTAKKKEWRKFSKALTRLDRFPRFYSAKETRNFSAQGGGISRNQIVWVEFLDENDWTGSGQVVGMA